MIGFFGILKNIEMLTNNVILVSEYIAENKKEKKEKIEKFKPSRELPVVLRLLKYSLYNKIILVPMILLMEMFLPVFTYSVLVIAGIYLSYEGYEAAQIVLSSKDEKNKENERILKFDNLLIAEKKKIISAVFLDCSVSIIMIIKVFDISNKVFGTEMSTISVGSVVVSSIMLPIIIYGILFLVIRIVDFGIFFIESKHSKSIGIAIISTAKFLLNVFLYIGIFFLLYVSGVILLYKTTMTYNAFFENLTLMQLLIVASKVITSYILGFVTFTLSKLPNR